MKFQSSQASNDRPAADLEDTNLVLNFKSFWHMCAIQKLVYENCTHDFELETWKSALRKTLSKSSWRVEEDSRGPSLSALGIALNTSNCVKFSFNFPFLVSSRLFLATSLRVCTICQSCLTLPGCFKLLTLQWASGTHGSETSRPARGVLVYAQCYKAQKRYFLMVFDGSFVFLWASIQWYTTCCCRAVTYGSALVHMRTAC